MLLLGGDASSAQSRLNEHQSGLAEGRAAQPHGSAGEDGGCHASIENVLCQCSQTVMLSDNVADDNDVGADDDELDDTVGKILGTSFTATHSLDLDLAIGAVDSNVDLARTHLLFPLSPLPLSLASPPSSAAAREPI